MKSNKRRPSVIILSLSGVLLLLLLVANLALAAISDPTDPPPANPEDYINIGKLINKLTTGDYGAYNMAGEGPGDTDVKDLADLKAVVNGVSDQSDVVASEVCDGESYISNA